VRLGQLLLGIGSLAAIALSLAIYSGQQRQAEGCYQQEVATAAAQLQSAVEGHESTLRQLHDMFMAIGNVTPRQFKQVAQALRDRHPEILQAGWVEVPDPGALLGRLEGASLAEGLPLAPVTYLEPHYSQQPIEWDLAGPPTDLRGALAEALAQGVVALPPTKASMLPGNPVSLVLLMPVFHSTAPVGEHRIDGLRGFVTLTLLAEPVLQRSLQPLLGASRLELVAASELAGTPLGYTPVVELLRHPASEWHFEPERTVQITLRGSGRHWLLRAQPLEAARAEIFYPGLLLALYLGLSGLLALYLRRSHGQERELAAALPLRAVEVAEAEAALTRLADVDLLTGVANRDRLDDELVRDWRRAQRHREPMGLLLIDVDHLRNLNEASGHDLGDAALKEIAQALQRCSELPGALLARYESDCFALLLPACGRGVEGVAQRCRQAVIDLLLPHPRSDTAGVVTVSVGAAWLVPGGALATASLLTERANAALAQAKAAGRNRVEVVEDA
jgi:diguanylate cyclase (GGDEF)-like protein